MVRGDSQPLDAAAEDVARVDSGKAIEAELDRHQLAQLKAAVELQARDRFAVGDAAVIALEVCRGEADARVDLARARVLVRLRGRRRSRAQQGMKQRSGGGNHTNRTVKQRHPARGPHGAKSSRSSGSVEVRSLRPVATIV